MRWLLYGIFAALLFGLWGLFDRLSSQLNPFTSNIIMYFVALLVVAVMLVWNKKFRFSKYSILSGIFAGIGNFFVLYALMNNFLILVFPFVSAAGVIFFCIIYFTERPKYTAKQKIIVSIGLFLSVIGVLLVAVGQQGLFNFLKQLTISTSYIIPAIFVMAGFSLWTYFTYKSVTKENINALTYNFWTNLASFVLALIAVLILNYSTFSELKALMPASYIYPVLAGLCISIGTLLTYSAFKTTTTKTKLQEAIVAILANGELIPLLFLSYFVLGEWVFEGFIGAIIVFIGLFLIHYAEVSK
jgi:drug/metabolite transporter (DMT)-like permease